MTRDAVVVGSGLAGLTAALRLAQQGAKVALVAKGVGGLQLSQGTLDVLGYAPTRVTEPYAALPRFVAAHPEHPYAQLDASLVRAAVELVAQVAGLMPSEGVNLQLPTAVGGVRPTLHAPSSMLAGEVVDGKRFLVVGLRHFKDFPAELIAGNLNRADVPGGGAVEARHVWLDLPVRPGEHDSNGVTWARALDGAEFRSRFVEAVRGAVAAGETVLLPAVLGLEAATFAEIEAQVGHPVAEVPVPPPGVPGMRMARALNDAVRAEGVRVINGSDAIGAVTEGTTVRALRLAQAGRVVEMAGKSFVYAPGGFESGALVVDSACRISEPALGLPLTQVDSTPLISPDFWGSDQALFRVGVRTDPAGRVIDAAGAVVYDNLFAAGGILAGANRWREKSGDGIAAASGLRAAEEILGGRS